MPLGSVGKSLAILAGRALPFVNFSFKAEQSLSPVSQGNSVTAFQKKKKKKEKKQATLKKDKENMKNPYWLCFFVFCQLDSN